MPAKDLEPFLRKKSASQWPLSLVNDQAGLAAHNTNRFKVLFHYATEDLTC